MIMISLLALRLSIAKYIQSGNLTIRLGSDIGLKKLDDEVNVRCNTLGLCIRQLYNQLKPTILASLER
jgi:hypothetical protein